MIDPKTIEGFVCRPDGYWYKTADGTLHSTCPKRGELMLAYLHRMSQDSDLPYMKEDTKYILSSIRYNIVVRINLFLEAINNLVKKKKKK